MSCHGLLVVGAGVVSETKHVCYFVISHAAATDALHGHVRDVGIDQCTGLVELELAGAVELMPEGVYLAPLS